MEFVLIAFSFLGSIAFTVIMRRMDKNNSSMQKIKRLAEIQSHSLDERSQNHLKEIKDAVLDFEVLIRQSRQLQNELKSDLGAYEEKISSLSSEQEIVEGISREVEHVVQGAGTISEQVERLDLGLQRLGLAQEEMTEIRRNLDYMNQEMEQIKIDTADRLNETIDQLIEETNQKSRQFVDQVRDTFVGVKEEMTHMEERINARNQEAEHINEKILRLDNRFEERWNIENDRMMDKLGEMEERLGERVRSMEAGLNNIRTQAVDALRAEVVHIRSDMDDFNLEAISKRDEIMNDARRNFEKMNDQIQLFQEKYLEAENHILKFTEEQNDAVKESLQEMESRWKEEETRRLTSLQSKLAEAVSDIESYRDAKIDAFDVDFSEQKESLRTYALSLSSSLERLSNEIANSVRNLHRDEEKSLLSYKEDLDQLKENLTQLGQEIKSNLRGEMEHSLSMLKEARHGHEEHLLQGREEMDRIKYDLTDRVESAEEILKEINKSRSKLEDRVQEAIGEIRDTQEHSISGMEKKASRFTEDLDERLDHMNEIMDEKISGQIARLVDEGQLQLDELQKRTKAIIREYAMGMHGDLDSAREEFKKLREEITTEMEQTRRLKDQVFTEIEKDSHRLESFMEKLQLVDQAEELTVRLDEILEVMSDRLKEAGEESGRLMRFHEQLIELRDSREEMETEIKRLENMRKRIYEAEENYRNINKELEKINANFETLETGEKMAEDLEERMHQLLEFKETFDKYYLELGDKRKYLDNAIRFIEKSKKDTRDAVDIAEKLMQKVERAEIRQEDVKEYLSKLEKRTASLHKMDGEIQKVEARFEQMDGLLVDLEEKQKQISSMSRRMDEMKDGSSEMKVELESLLSEADEKMDRLTAFYQTIDASIDQAFDHQSESGGRTKVAVKTGGKEKSGVGGLSEWKREGILSLYLNHKWDADLIAERTKIDPAVVRAVIQSHT